MDISAHKGLAVIGFVLIIFVSQSIWDLFSPVETNVAKILGVNVYFIVLLAILYPIVFFILTVPSGILLDRDFKFWLLIGSIITFIGGFSRIFIFNYWIILISQILAAIGQPFILNAFVPFADVFERKQSILSVFTISMYAGTLYPLVTGFRFFSMGGTLLLIYPIAFISLVGITFLLLGIKSIDLKASIRIYDPRIIKALVKDRETWILGILMGLGILSYSNLISWLQPVLSSVGLGNLAGYCVALSIITGLIGIPVVNSIIIDRKIESIFLKISLLLSSISFCFLAFVLNSMILLTLISLTGFLLLPLYAIIMYWIEEHFGEGIQGTVTGLVGLVSRALSGLSLIFTYYFVANTRMYFSFIALLLIISFISSIAPPKNHGPHIEVSR